MTYKIEESKQNRNNPSYRYRAEIGVWGFTSVGYGRNPAAAVIMALVNVYAG